MSTTSCASPISTAGNDNPSFRHGRPALALVEAAVKYLLGLHIRDDLTGIRFVPTPVTLPSGHTKLDNEVLGEVLRLD